MEKLNNKRMELMDQVRDEWLDRFNSLEFNEVKAKEMVDWLYEFSGLEKPIKIVLDSPLSLQMGANLLKSSKQVKNQVWEQVYKQVKNQVWDQVRNQVSNQVGKQVEEQVGRQVYEQVRNQVWNQVYKQVGKQVKNQVWDQVSEQVGNQVEEQVRNQVLNQVYKQVGKQVLNQVWNQVCEQVRNQVRDQVWDQVSNQVGKQVEEQVGRQVYEQVRNQVHNQVSEQVWNQVWNQVSEQVGNQVCEQVEGERMEYFTKGSYGGIDDFGWVSFYDFFERIGIIKNKKFEEFRELLKSSNIFTTIMLDKVCFISKPPIFLNRDEKNRLHCTVDYAIYFKDGFGLHYVHGVRFNPEDFEKYVKNKPTAQEILKVENAEQKSALIQIYGYEEIISELEPKLIDTLEELSKVTGKPANCKLFEVEIDEITRRILLLEDHSTHKKTFLRVPTEIETALDGKKWSFKVNKYNMIMES